MIGSFITSVRRNHALEHATVSVLLGRLGPSFRLVGRAAHDGFFLFSDLPADLIADASREALDRMQRGESHLAVSPLCGTNIAVGGILAGISSIAALGSRERSRLDRLPNVCMAAAVGIMAAQPVGRWLQQYVTTDPAMDGIRITGVTTHGGIVPYHKVHTVSEGH